MAGHSGPRAFSGRFRLLKPQHLRRTEDYFTRHGALTILLTRFLPLLRTFAPFVAGVGRMRYLTFQVYNVAGAIAWSTLFIWGGYLFGNLPVVKANFGLVTLGIIAVSLLPMLWALVNEVRISRRRAGS